MKWLPNALTILRCVLAFVVGWAILVFVDLQNRYDLAECAAGTSTGSCEGYWHFWPGWPFVLFVSAALLDYFDGLAARSLNATSAFGAWLDPLADKLLVGITLIVFSYSAEWHIAMVAPSIAIIGRDIAVTFLRTRIENGIAVSQAAKWKTMIAMIALGGMLLILGADGFGIPDGARSPIAIASFGLLYVAAILSLYTGYQYVRTAFSKPAP